MYQYLKILIAENEKHNFQGRRYGYKERFPVNGMPGHSRVETCRDAGC